MGPQTFLVTAATGSVGRPLTKKLLAMGHQVHALTTNPDTDRAQDLANAGAKLFCGALDDTAAIAKAAASCTGVYLNPMPANMANHFLEGTYAQNVIKASRDAQVRICVYQSVENVDTIATMPEWHEWISSAGVVAEYWKMKSGIQDAAQTAGFDSWSAIQGYAHVQLQPAVQESTHLHLIDPADLAELASRALTEPDRFNGLAFYAVAEQLTLGQIAATVARHANKPIRAHYPDQTAIAAQRATDLASGNGQVLSIFADRTDFTFCQSLGIRYNTLDNYLKDRRGELQQAVA